MRRWLIRFARRALVALLFAGVAAGLAATIVPRFLDRRYYRGPASDHYDGERFRNPDGEDTAMAPAGGRGGFLWRQLVGGDDRPPWPSRVAVKQSRPPARVAGERMLATWIGHATVLVQTQGLNILTDPVWSDRVGPFGFGPKRVAVPGVAFDDLPKIDLVLVSHAHYDHMDLKTLKRLWDRDRPAIVTSLGNDAILRDAGVEATALDWGGTATLGAGGLTVEGGTPRCDPDARCPDERAGIIVTRSHHWDSRWFADRNRALWSSFVVQLPGGNLFFAGDTGAGDLRWADEARALGPIRLAILPIGAFRFVPGQMAIGSHMGPVDAVLAFQRLGAARGMAVHWGTFRLSYEARDTPPRLLAQALRCSGIATDWHLLGQQFMAEPIGLPVAIPTYDLVVRPPPIVTLPPLTRAGLLSCLDTPAVRALR